MSILITDFFKEQRDNFATPQVGGGGGGREKCIFMSQIPKTLSKHFHKDSAQ